MGAYINRGNAAFTGYTNGEYIDKTGMIAYINSTLNTGNRLTCVTRPRRFGKSIAANMLCAYYDKSIKKYGTQSALNDFREYSMTNPGPMGGFPGFSDEDVKSLADSYGMNFAELKRWYDGYEMETFDWRIKNPKKRKTAIYNPNSVMTAIRGRRCDNYWAMTEAFDSLQRYIDNDFNGVKETLEKLITGVPIRINVLRFGNDMNNVSDNEELFTLLIHLGYLTYDPDLKQATLPNQEIREEYQKV